jgi:phage tail P2-like protein
MAWTIDNVSFLDFLNPACKTDRFFKAVAETLDPLFADIRSQIANNVILANLDNQSESTLDFLAQYHFNLQDYNLSYSFAQKLSLVKNAIVSKLYRGTASAVKSALSIGFDSASVIEWWQDQPPGPANTFRININDPLNDNARVAAMRAVIFRNKNARSFLASISSFLAIPTLPFYLTPASGEYDYSIIR